jgi:hypothetical protein
MWRLAGLRGGAFGAYFEKIAGAGTTSSISDDRASVEKSFEPVNNGISGFLTGWSNLGIDEGLHRFHHLDGNPSYKYDCTFSY